MADLLDGTPPRALAVYAHPDDAEVSCGGTLARWVRAGSEVHLVVCTMGEKGTVDPDADPVALRGRRAEEVAAAAAVLGLAGCSSLGYPDGELEDGAGLRASLVRTVRALRPHTVLCPDPTVMIFGEQYVNHRDHRIVGAVTLDAVAPAAARPLYFPADGPPHQVSEVLLSGTLEPSVWVDIAATLDDKVAAVACHRSQFADSGDWATAAVGARAKEEGRRAGIACAEAFRRIRLGA